MFTKDNMLLKTKFFITSQHEPMSSSSARTTRSTTYTHTTSTDLWMNRSTFEFLCDTLRDELEDNPYRDEIISLATEQLFDDVNNNSA